jgi:hypothetical protein
MGLKNIEFTIIEGVGSPVFYQGFQIPVISPRHPCYKIIVHVVYFGFYLKVIIMSNLRKSFI